MKDHNSVFVAWKSQETKSWHVVGLLTEKKQENSLFTFCYTMGAKPSSGFIPFSGMPELDKTYRSNELFPLFKNRLLSKRRPEYPILIKWLGLEENADVIDILSRSGGIRETDQLQVFQRVEFDENGSFEHIFFAHSLRYLAKEAQDRVSNLKKGERLLLPLDCQNSFDENAVIIRAENPDQIVGYCPRYLATDISMILRNDSSSIKVTVETVSQDAPTNYQLMCKLEGKIDKSQILSFMNQKEFQPFEEIRNKVLAS
jgi:hypothetical protein